MNDTMSNTLKTFLSFTTPNNAKQLTGRSDESQDSTENKEIKKTLHNKVSEG